MNISMRSETWLDVAGVQKAVQQAQVSRIDKAALLVEADAKQSMKAGGGGKGVPSPAETPPHVQTGNLRASITHARTPQGTQLVGPTRMAWYGRVHEFGSARHKNKRPFMRPALMRMMKKFPMLFRKLPLGRTSAGRRLNAKKDGP